MLVAAGFNFDLLRRWSEELLLRVLLWILCPPPVAQRRGLAARTQFSTSESCLGIGINRTYAKPKPTKLRRKRMDRRFGKLLLVVGLVDFYLRETAQPIWQNEAKNCSNIRRPIRRR